MRGHLTHPRKSNSGMSEIQWFELRPGRRNPAGVLRFTAHGLARIKSRPPETRKRGYSRQGNFRARWPPSYPPVDGP
jgi:hypothetical protein